MTIPATIEELTTDWLAAALSSHLVIPVEIVRMESEPLGAADSMTGAVYRTRIEYATGDIQPDAAPASVVVKFPKPRELRLPINLQQYRCEVGFYRDLAPRIDAAIPVAYWSELDPETDDYILVIQDFPDLIPGSNHDGCTIEQARVLLREMAALHARWWNTTDLASRDYLFTLTASRNRYMSLLPERVPIFLERHGPIVAPEERALIEALPTRFDAATAPLLDAPHTLTHGDLSVKNTLRGGTADAPAYVLIDWQLASIQPGVRDASFFIEHSIDPALRPRVEIELLHYYHSELTDRGVAGYEFDRLFDDYRRSVLCDIARFVIVGSTPRTTAEQIAVADTNILNAIRGRTGSARELRLHELVAE